MTNEESHDCITPGPPGQSWLAKEFRKIISFPGHFICAMCAGIFELGDDEKARAEAVEKGIDPDDSGMVCDDCYKGTPWGADPERN